MVKEGDRFEIDGCEYEAIQFIAIIREKNTLPAVGIVAKPTTGNEGYFIVTKEAIEERGKKL